MKQQLGPYIKSKNKQNNSSYKPINFNKYKQKDPNEPEPFVFKEEDFPPLC